MDPRATLARFIRYQGSDDGFAAIHDYNKWMAKGGFPAHVQAHPATDAWMRGDRFGEVIKIGRKWLHVRMLRSGRVLRFAPENILRNDGSEF